MTCEQAQIPTPLVGINGLKQIEESNAVSKTLYSNASCRYKWIETSYITIFNKIISQFQRLL